MSFDHALKILGVIIWPTTALVAFIISLIFFKKDLTRFLDRLKSISREGLTTETVSNTEQQTIQVNLDSNPKHAKDLLESLESPVLLGFKKTIRDDLKKRNLKHDGDSVDVLIAYLAESNLKLKFEQIYRLIFGSQIYFLKKINERGGLSQKEVFEYFENIKKIFTPHFNEWDLEKYIMFLKSSHLIFESDSKFVISDLGIEFLSWLVKSGNPEVKNL